MMMKYDLPELTPEQQIRQIMFNNNTAGYRNWKSRMKLVFKNPDLTPEDYIKNGYKQENKSDPK